MTGDGVLREVVGVRDPTDLVRELLVVAREVGGTPAVDRVADVLGRADDDGEDDEKEDGVAMVKAIDEVVVVAHVHLRDLGDGVDETARIHGGVRNMEMEADRHTDSESKRARPLLPGRGPTRDWRRPVAGRRAVRERRRCSCSAEFGSGRRAEERAGGRH